MKYEKTGKKTVSKDQSDEYVLKSVSTSKMLWVAVRRHKFGIVSTLAVLGWSLYLVPFWPAELVDWLGSVLG